MDCNFVLNYLQDMIEKNLNFQNVYFTVQFVSSDQSAVIVHSMNHHKFQYARQRFDNNGVCVM